MYLNRFYNYKQFHTFDIIVSHFAGTVATLNNDNKKKHLQHENALKKYEEKV